MKNLKLSQFNVQLKESLSWGESKDIQAVMLENVKITSTGQADGISALAIREAIYKALEFSIVSIEDEQKNTTTFSKEWMNKLTIEDGNILEKEANNYLGGMSNQKKN